MPLALSWFSSPLTGSLYINLTHHTHTHHSLLGCQQFSCPSPTGPTPHGPRWCWSLPGSLPRSVVFTVAKLFLQCPAPPLLENYLQCSFPSKHVESINLNFCWCRWGSSLPGLPTLSSLIDTSRYYSGYYKHSLFKKKDKPFWEISNRIREKVE